MKTFLSFIAFLAFPVSVAFGGEINVSCPANVEVYNVCEMKISGLQSADGVNPYDPQSISVDAIIVSPSKKNLKVPAFYYQVYRRGKSFFARNERVREMSQSGWRIRFAPKEAGKYFVRIVLSKGDGLEVDVGSCEFSAAVSASGSDGFLKVNPKVPSRFMFDSGKGYFAIGHNVCWVKRERGTYGFDHYFSRMAEAGENYTRVWLCTWGLGLETEKPYEFDQEDAWRLDHVFELARKKGIYVKLCLYNFHDFVHNFDKSPFATGNGGPCRDKVDFFLNEKALRMQKAMLRYLVARYGAYSSLMAWELWNEMNYSLNEERLLHLARGDEYSEDVSKRILTEWTDGAAKYLRGIDAHGHLVTTSLGMHDLWPKLWENPNIDFAQYHCYLHEPEYFSVANENDAAAFVLYAQQRINVFGKPSFLAEFGYRGMGESSDMNPQDPLGIALHNAIWAGTMGGGSGTPSLWWWDNYIDPYNLYYHYRGLSEFLKDVDWSRDYKPMRAENASVRILALRSPDDVMLWIQNRQSTWYRRIHLEEEPNLVRKLAFRLSAFTPGNYSLQWFDPARASVITEYQAKAPDGNIKITVPDFRTDIACRLRLTAK